MTDIVISYEFLQDAADKLKVIAHPIRLQIIEVLRDGAKSVTEIQEAIGEQQAVTSQHLALLKNKGILLAEREATKVYYSISDIRTLLVLDCIKKCDMNEPK